MEETYYMCDKPATYWCEADSCSHQMCRDHGVMSRPGSADARTDGDGQEHDHQHFCLDHAYLAKQ